MEPTRHNRATDRIDANPCAIEGAGAASRKIKPRPLTIEELDVLVGEMPDNFKAMTLLGVWGALRFGELIEIRQFDIGGDVVKIRRGAVRVNGTWVVGPLKSDAGIRDVIIPAHILPALRHHLEVHTDPEKYALLFPGQLDPYRADVRSE
jgi:integrase